MLELRQKFKKFTARQINSAVFQMKRDGKVKRVSQGTYCFLLNDDNKTESNSNDHVSPEMLIECMASVVTNNMFDNDILLKAIRQRFPAYGDRRTMLTLNECISRGYVKQEGKVYRIIAVN
jgi:hypothetical protein